jgi:hypothetical protein
MPNANSAVQTQQLIDPEDRPLYIWLKEPVAPLSTSTYLVYPEDDGTDRPVNPYGQH